MSDQNTDKELSIDELKDVSGGISWDLPDTEPGVFNLKGKKKSKEGFTDADGDDLSRFSDQRPRPSNVIFPGNEDLD